MSTDQFLYYWWNQVCSINQCAMNVAVALAYATPDAPLAICLSGSYVFYKTIGISLECVLQAMEKVTHPSNVRERGEGGVRFFHEPRRPPTQLGLGGQTPRPVQE